MDMGPAFLRGVHSRLKSAPGLRKLDALIIAICFGVAVPLWLKTCKFLLWIRLAMIAATGGKPVVVVARYGAIGDIICTFPAVAELVRQNAGCPVIYVVRRSLKALVERSGVKVKVVAARNHLALPTKPARLFKQSVYLCYPGEYVTGGYTPVRLTEGFARCLGFADLSGQPSLRVDRAKVEALRARYRPQTGPPELNGPAIPQRAGMAQGRSSAPDRPMVLLHGGPTWAVKEWPLECWSRLAHRLKMELGCVVLQLVAARNITVKSPVCEIIPGAEPVECQDDICKLIHLVAAVDLLVGIDSGPIHVAGAVRTPCVALFGPTDPNLILSNRELATEVFHRVECSFCHHRYPRLHWKDGCPNGIKCMRELTVGQVFAAVAGALTAPLVADGRR